LDHGGWDLWVAVCGVMGSVDSVLLILFVRGFLNTLARDNTIITYFTPFFGD